MASPVDTSVKHAYSSMTGVSPINGNPGSMIPVLRAFLVTGWGSKAVDSASVSNGVCRLVFASGKSAAELHAVITVLGASPAALNGEQRVTAVANGWVEFKTDLPDGAVTGSISFKMAGLGWEEVYSKTNVSVFRPTDPRGTRMFYRIDDTAGGQARVQMYESMTDVDTGVGVSPSLAGGWYWIKSNNYPDSTARYWMLIGNARSFYFFACAGNSSATTPQAGSYGLASFAGDLNSYKSGDAWCGMVSGLDNSNWTDRAGCLFQCAEDKALFAIARQSHGIGSTASSRRRAYRNGTSGADGTLGGYPSRVDNGLRLSPIIITDGVDSAPRGEMPGAWYCPQSGVMSVLGNKFGFVAGTGEFAGKTFLTVPLQGDGSNSGIGFFDASGPWEVVNG